MRDDQGVRANQPVAAEAPIPRRPARPAIPGKSAEVRDASFFSNALQRVMQHRVLLPESYATSGKRYPVLYLLHGVFGDHTNWDSLTEIATYVQPYELIVAMPDGDNSWYTNSATAPADKFEDYIVQDFVREIEANYRVVAETSARAVAGLSMGGYAAIKFALKFPDKFIFAGSISGALNAPRDLHERRADLRDRLLEVYGGPTDPTRAANDVYRLACVASSSAIRYLYLDCGADDEFLASNREFVAVLQAKKLQQYSQIEVSGGHDWSYWDQRIGPLLAALTKIIKRA